MGDSSRRTEDRCRKTVRVWDMPVRLFHWLFAAAFAGAWLTASDRHLHVHVFAGYAFGALLAFRLAWGFIGTRHARFRDFVRGPGAVGAHLTEVLRGRPARGAGHNPAGGWAILAMLALGLTIAASGLATLGGQEQEGPLAGRLGFAAGDLARLAHEMLAWTMLTVVAVHIGGVLVESRLLGENLPAAMVTGRRRLPGVAVPARNGIAAAMVVALALGALFYFRDALDSPAGTSFVPYAGPQLPDHALWRDECGGCHLAYHPTLLPARSWHAIVSGQHQHFGEDLALDAETIARLTTFMIDNAAESSLTQAAWQIQRRTPHGETPLRITQTRYWQVKHADLPRWVWSAAKVQGRGDCAACHLDADAGTFRAGAMRLPAKPAVARRLPTRASGPTKADSQAIKEIAS
jgi:cytochrome b